ncbi:MAG: hypothetical protein ACLR9W_10410 [Enterobacter hormaechei]
MFFSRAPLQRSPSISGWEYWFVSSVWIVSEDLGIAERVMSV